MTCLDCPHFKMTKGWKYAYCSAGQLIASYNYSDKDRLFKWITGKNKIRKGQTLIERAKKIKALQGCKLGKLELAYGK